MCVCVVYERERGEAHPMLARGEVGLSLASPPCLNLWLYAVGQPAVTHVYTTLSAVQT